MSCTSARAVEHHASVLLKVHKTLHPCSPMCTKTLHQSCSKCSKTLHPCSPMCTKTLHHRTRVVQSAPKYCTRIFKVHQNSAPSFLCTRVLRLKLGRRRSRHSAELIICWFSSNPEFVPTLLLANVHRAVFGGNVICNECFRRKKQLKLGQGSGFFSPELVLFWWFCVGSRVGGGAAKVQRPEKAAARFSSHKA